MQSGSIQEINQMLREVRVFYHSLVQIGDTLHRDVDISLGMRAVLEYLQLNGATTVPDIARSRRVTRQRIQTMVNQLRDKGLVTTMRNPRSERSPLIDLTSMGKSTMHEMQGREAQLLSKVEISEKEIRTAQRVLSTVRQQLEAAI